MRQSSLIFRRLLKPWWGKLCVFVIIQLVFVFVYAGYIYLGYKAESKITTPYYTIQSVTNILPDYLRQFPSIYEYGERISALAACPPRLIPLLSDAKYLRALEINRIGESESGNLAGIGKLKQLEYLCIRDGVLRPDDCVGLSQLRNLKYLEIRMSLREVLALLKSDDFKELKIQTLYVYLDQFGPVEIQKLEQLKHVDSIEVQLTTLTDDQILSLSQLRHLHALNIYGRRKGNSILDCRTIGRLKTLVSLEITDCNLAEDMVLAISRLPNLERLTMQGVPLNEKDVVYFNRMKSLKAISCRDAQLRDSAIPAIVNLIKLEHLKKAGFYRNKFTDEGQREMDQFYDALKQRQTVKPD